MFSRNTSRQAQSIFPKSQFTHSSALRCIGQALEMHDLKAFDVQCENYELRLDSGYQTPPSATPVRLRYTNEDLKALDSDGQARRNGTAKAIDFFNLTEILRGLGALIDKKGGHLVRISNNDSSIANGSIRLEYTDPNGNLQKDVFPLSSIYEICVVMYKERGKTVRSSKVFVD